MDTNSNDTTESVAASAPPTEQTPIPEAPIDAAGDPAPDPTQSPAASKRFGSLRPGIAAKILGVTLLLAGAIVAVVTSRSTDALSRSLRRSFESKGEAIALSLAAAAERGIGSELTSLQGFIDSNKVIDDVEYVFIRAPDGTVPVHTFSPMFPPALSNANRVELMDVLNWESRRVAIAEVHYQGATGPRTAIDVAAPIAGGAVGVVHVGMSSEAIALRVAELRRSLLSAGGLIVGVGGSLALLLLYVFVIGPMRALTRAAAAVAHGDLTHPLRLRSTDELGQLADTFRFLVDRLRAIPLRLQDSLALLGDSVDNLEVATEEQAKEIAQQAAAIQEAQATVGEMKQTSSLAAEKADGVLGVAARAGDLGRAGESAIDETLTVFGSCNQQVTEVADRIGQLRDRTRQIGLITETVKDLADQSNMLAFNAAIEAVRSGEHGKGFSVVAREIRTLADQSIQATNRVREILDDISTAIGGAVTMSEKGSGAMQGGLAQARVSGEKLQELSGIVQDNATAARQIAAAVSQQNAGINEIFAAVQRLNDAMDASLARLDATRAHVDTLKTASSLVTNVLHTFHVG